MVLVMRFVWMIGAAVWIYSLVDVITTTNGLTRHLPKATWVFIVLFGSVIGAGAWLAFGRPEKAGYLPGDTNYRKPINFGRGPDDNPEFLRNLGTRPPAEPEPPPTETAATGAAGAGHPAAGGGRTADELAAWDADLQRREDELRRRESGEG